MPPTTATNADYDIRVAEDQLTAMVRIDAEGSINAQQLIRQLKRAGIQFIDEAAIAAEAAAPEPAPGEGRPKARDIVVARGQAAVEDVPEKLIKIDPAPPETPPQNHYERVQIETVKGGEAIATIVPAVPGRDGVDVFGRPLKRRKTVQPLAPDDGARRDGLQMLAVRDGRVRIDGSRIRVEPRLDIPGDVSFATGNIRFDGDVNIRGSVLDLFLVGSTADVYVGGAVEAARVHAGADITVGGGIAGKDKGQVTASGTLKCRYLSNAHVVAGQGVRVTGDVRNSRVMTGGRMNVEHGTILAGRLTANGGVICRTLGSPAFVKTLVEVGVDPGLRRLAHDLLPDLQKCLNESQHMRDVVQPLLRDRKRLNPAEREKATQLLFAAAQSDQALTARLAEFNAALEASTLRCRAEVTVTDVLYPGVTVRLPGLSATVSTPFKGPLTIAARKRQIMVMNDSSGSVIPLVTQRVQDDDAQDLETILQLAA